MRANPALRMLLLAAATAATIATGSAQVREDQSAACYSDAFRLCSAQIPDERAIEVCLEANRPSLSPACSAQFDPLPAPKARARR